LLLVDTKPALPHYLPGTPRPSHECSLLHPWFHPASPPEPTTTHPPTCLFPLSS
jgi:hypothetical protein